MIGLDSSIMKHDREFPCTQVEDRWRIARYAFMNRINARAGITGYTQTNATLSNRQRQAVTGVSQWVVTGSARGVQVAAEDLVEEQVLSKRDLFHGRVAVIVIITVTDRLHCTAG